MTTYSAIANGDIDVDSPITTDLMTALRDNPLSIAEDDGTSPLVIGLNPIAAYNISSASTLDITGVLTSDYDYYEIVLVNLVPSATSSYLTLRMSPDDGTTWYSGGSDYVSTISGGASARLTSTATSTTRPFSGKIELFDPIRATVRTHGKASIVGEPSAGTVTLDDSAFMDGQDRGGNNQITAIRLYFSSGNISTGDVYVYGRRVRDS